MSGDSAEKVDLRLTDKITLMLRKSCRLSGYQYHVEVIGEQINVCEGRQSGSILFSFYQTYFKEGPGGKVLAQTNQGWIAEYPSGHHVAPVIIMGLIYWNIF